MRGGFVACFGGNVELPDHIAEQLRWHRGDAVRYRGQGVEIAAFVDEVDGPTIETRRGLTMLVHGTSPAPLPDLQQQRTRFAALEWDGTRLCASRDPLGLAPLFYRIHGGAIWLATEVAPLVSLGAPAADLEALSARAAFVPLDDRTGWSGIHRVLPGCTLEIKFPNVNARSSRYWSPGRLFGTYRGNYQDALSEFRDRFQVAVKRCFEPRSAILLSGGLDSAAVALATRTTGHGSPHLVHVHFADLPQTQEKHYAAAVANTVGVPLDTVQGQIAPWDVDAELDMRCIPYNWLPYGMDEPALRHIADAGLNVALDGHDGDGVLGAPGNGIWGSLLLAGEFRRVLRSCRRNGAARALRGVAADFVPPIFRPTRYRLPTYMESVARYFTEPLRGQFTNDDIFRWDWPSSLWRKRQILPLLPRAVVSFEQKEIEAASHGIDLRHPFADRELVEFLISLPCAIKSDPGRTKPLLVDALRDELPAILHERRKSDYMAVVQARVDPARCIETIRESRVRLPNIEYTRLFDDGECNPDRIPLVMLVNLVRAHAFARRAA